MLLVVCLVRFVFSGVGGFVLFVGTCCHAQPPRDEVGHTMKRPRPASDGEGLQPPPATDAVTRRPQKRPQDE